MDPQLMLYDRKNFKAVKFEGTIKKENIDKVRQKFYKNENGQNVEGSAVHLKEPMTINGVETSKIELANLASDARRILGVIEAKPAGSDPVRTN